MWGWGHVATGARWGWLLVALQAAALVALWLVVPAARGTGVVVVFLAGVAVLAAWAGIAVHAHRRAARRRAALDLPTGPSGAADLLWLAPLAIALSTGLWIAGGRSADPGLVLDQYLDDWSAGRAEAAIGRFVAPPGSVTSVTDAWEAQRIGLRNDLVRVAAESGLGGEVNPDLPFESVRWSAGGTFDDDRGRVVVAEVVRRETVRSEVLGFLPTSSQRLVTVARLGEVRLRAVPSPSGIGVEWRIERIEAGGVVLGR